MSFALSIIGLHEFRLVHTSVCLSIYHIFQWQIFSAVKWFPDPGQDLMDCTVSGGTVAALGTTPNRGEVLVRKGEQTRATAHPVGGATNNRKDATTEKATKTPVGGETKKRVGERTNNPMGGATKNPVPGGTKNPAGGATNNPVSGATNNSVSGATKTPMDGATKKPLGGGTKKPVGGATKNASGGGTKNTAGGATKNPVGGATNNPVGGATGHSETAAVENVGGIGSKRTHDSDNLPVQPSKRPRDRVAEAEGKQVVLPQRRPTPVPTPTGSCLLWGEGVCAYVKGVCGFF